jgi:hypothetical protein
MTVLQSCHPSSLCSKLHPDIGGISGCGSCGCYELVTIGGGIAGGTLDAKALGMSRAIVLNADSTLSYYQRDSVAWRRPFHVYTRFLKQTPIRITVIDLGFEDAQELQYVYRFSGPDTIVAFHEGWIDDSPLAFVRHR